MLTIKKKVFDKKMINIDKKRKEMYYNNKQIEIKKENDYDYWNWRGP